MNIWIALLAVAIGTFVMRISFLGDWARGEFPPKLDRALRFAPPVIFAALITPMILKTGVDLSAAQLWPRIAAAGITLGWALRFGGQVGPLIVGMLSLHGFKLIAAVARM